MNKQIIIKISDEQSGKAIKNVLSHMGFSSGIVRGLKKAEDGITLNGKPVHTNICVNRNDILSVTLRDKNSPNILPVDLPLDILYEDDDVLAVNKPRAMPTHPSQNHHDDTLANAVMYYFRGREFTFRAVTRLDCDTSGIVLVAKNAFCAQLLNNDIKNGLINKEYYAIVNGIPNPPRNVLSAPIKRVENSVILRCVSPDGKQAITEYNVLETKNELALMHLVPRTGRTHQLRVHMSYIGHPIYGDDLYGAPQSEDRTLLHCGRLGFTHPITKKNMELICPLPQDMLTLIR